VPQELRRTGKKEGRRSQSHVASLDTAEDWHLSFLNPAGSKKREMNAIPGAASADDCGKAQM
jgi:hypothetical protein